jgi:hypothetical protein
MRFGASRYVLVNEVGEFLFLDEVEPEEDRAELALVGERRDCR